MNEQDLKERNFEADIEQWLLTDGGYTKGDQKTYNKERTIDMTTLIKFIALTILFAFSLTLLVFAFLLVVFIFYISINLIRSSYKCCLEIK